MKTRVTEWFNHRWGVNIYHVEKWAEWDDPELREYCRGKPDQYAWRHVISLMQMDKAIGIAERLSKDETASSEVVVWQSEADQPKEIR